MKIIDTGTHKIIQSERYNEIFRYSDGFTMSFGRTVYEDPEGPCPYGPTLADIEISSSCEDDVNSALQLNIITDGGCDGFCKNFCYKKNTFNKSVHMSLDMLKMVLDKFTPALSQIAYGICSLQGHPQLIEILEETRRRKIVPNMTINGSGLTNKYADKLSKLCGAIAVSVNPLNKEIAYDSIKKLSQDFNMKQINIHVVISEESAGFVKQVCDDMKNDYRLSKCNCVVILSFKNKTGTKCFSHVTQSTYNQIINYYLDNQCPVGADSCSGAAFKRAIVNRKNNQELIKCITNCESLSQSFYVNVFGYAYACSFCEGVDDWNKGINLLDCDSVMDIWDSAKVAEWRARMCKRGFECPYYQIGI